MLEDTTFINVRGSLLLARNFSVRERALTASILTLWLSSRHFFTRSLAALRSFSVRDGHNCLSGRASFTILMYFTRAITKNRRKLKLTHSTFVRVHMASHAMGHGVESVIASSAVQKKLNIGQIFRLYGMRFKTRAYGTCTHIQTTLAH